MTLSIKTTYFRWQTYDVIQVNEVNQIIWLFNFSLPLFLTHTLALGFIAPCFNSQTKREKHLKKDVAAL